MAAERTTLDMRMIERFLQAVMLAAVPEAMEALPVAHQAPAVQAAVAVLQAAHHQATLAVEAPVVNEELVQQMEEAVQEAVNQAVGLGGHPEVQQVIAEIQDLMIVIRNIAAFQAASAAQESWIAKAHYIVLVTASALIAVTATLVAPEWAIIESVGVVLSGAIWNMELALATVILAILEEEGIFYHVTTELEILVASIMMSGIVVMGLPPLANYALTVALIVGVFVVPDYVYSDAILYIESKYESVKNIVTDWASYTYNGIFSAENLDKERSELESSSKINPRVNLEELRELFKDECGLISQFKYNDGLTLTCAQIKDIYLPNLPEEVSNDILGEFVLECYHGIA